MFNKDNNSNNNYYNNFSPNQLHFVKQATDTQNVYEIYRRI